ncbi:MAG: DNA repair protein RecO [Owenweeksia sp.]|nr:DNA repair protein RecO [Owenweeksia sp.]
MFAKTPAIVLSTVKYGDHSLIIKAYTREAGLMGFIAGNLHAKNGVIRPSMTLPFSVLHLVYYDRSRGDLKRLMEARVSQPMQELFYQPVKSSLAMFLAEILRHVLQEDEPDPQLYIFIENAIVSLDKAQSGLGSFHLKFLYQLTEYLGFKPESPHGTGHYIDLMNGVYTNSELAHPHFLNRDETDTWRQLHHADKDLEKSSLSLKKADREVLLKALVEYYRLHVRDFGQLRSLEILKEVLA